MPPTMATLLATPPARCVCDVCIECEHPLSATSRPALGAAVKDHVDYVNTQLPRADDPHFAIQRLDVLAQ